MRSAAADETPRLSREPSGSSVPRRPASPAARENAHGRNFSLPKSRAACLNTRAVNKPLALLCYENLLTGNQLLNRLHDQGYRTALVADPDRLVEQAVADLPLLVAVELATRTDQVCEAVRQLKRHQPTAHVPVLAYAKLGAGKGDRRFNDAARGAGIDLLANEAGLLTQLPQLLDQVLQVE